MAAAKGIPNSLNVRARRALVTASITIAVLLFVLLLWYAVDVCLLVFAGILLAIFLRSLSDWFSSRTNLSGGWSLAVVVLALILILSGGLWMLAPDVAAQVDQLTDSLPRAARQLSQTIERYQWGRQLLAHVPEPGALMSNRADVLARITGVFSMTLGVIANFVIFLFIGIYLAAEPDLYKSGLVQLLPANWRARADEVLNAVGQTLRWWLLGRLISMVVVGVVTAAGLWLLNVPLALTLGLLAAFLNFVPNIGPLLSVIPAALLALTESPTRALYVLLLYLTVQAFESYMLTPFVQRRTLSMPPVLTIIAQVVLGVLLGWIGLVIATPLTAVALVIVKMLYVEDTLGDKVPSDQPGHN